MAVGDALVFPGFLTQFSFQIHRILFSHALAEMRGENTQERKVRLESGFKELSKRKRNPLHVMNVYLNVNEPCSVKRGHNPFWADTFGL